MNAPWFRPRRLVGPLLLLVALLPALPAAAQRLLESAETVPARDQWLQPGDRLQLRVKAQPGARVSVLQTLTPGLPGPDGKPTKVLREVPLTELSAPDGKRGSGIYQLSYVVQAADTTLGTVAGRPLLVRLQLPDGRRDSLLTKTTVRLLNPALPQLARTNTSLAYLNYGLGEDRLGGAKIGYLDSLVLLHVTGRVGEYLRVRLAENQTAWVPDETVRLLPPGGFAPQSLTGSWSVSGDEQYDYVRVPLQERLPYRSQLQLEPTRLVVDVFGATSNTNWITQRAGLREITNVYYEQPQPDVFRIVIDLRHRQSWGYAIGYQNNVLTIRVRRPPARLELKGLTVAVDAGHGGDNQGAVGSAGVMEKTLTLSIAQKLRAELEKAGATVLMTREADVSVGNELRIRRLRKLMPQLLVSVHVNSTGSAEAKGTAAFYRYVAFRPLSAAIYEQMQQTGLAPWGNVGSFNFGLNGPTEYPNALVETAFISNPDDEKRLLDPAFQQQIAERITVGLENFLKATRAKRFLGHSKTEAEEQ
ncbi:N-acetylmuramoyl-L-alanine amidase [Hymenobacter jeollabukensis]|uniref:N-acetylmuramoyl-L-alanine amidase n=1 Tax=Hymenobacter jeollabukensis TaxID=2025313 RepID=A0A5R8WRS2_9BACT|nr:N-acetylmuramoyl-L-alanine amidase [Hymenobacter jeollabukensis]TLM93873.1 AMIN domain-containing protein [Hymenobacter jeollabukensis]